MPFNQGKILFELPIADKGNVICTQPREKVYLVTFTSPPDNRLVTVRRTDVKKFRSNS